MQDKEKQKSNYPSEKSYDRFVRFSIATDTILKNIQKYKNEKLEAFGLRSMHLMYLYCLDKESGGMTPVELAKKCSVDKAFISRVTTELRKLGYVNYDSDMQNDEKKDSAKYKKRLLLTDEGKRIMTSINEMVTDAVEKVTSGVTREQLDTFYFVLSKFDENIDGLLSAD